MLTGVKTSGKVPLALFFGDGDTVAAKKLGEQNPRILTQNFDKLLELDNPEGI